MKERIFHLPKDAIDPDLAPGRGSCIATDMITVEGHKVGYMYRERPDTDIDSGWRFFAGVETDEYANDRDHLAFYDVNTIANCDPAIIPRLDAPFGSAFERDALSNEFRPVEPPGIQ